jgi:hypothetical protein
VAAVYGGCLPMSYFRVGDCRVADKPPATAAWTEVGNLRYWLKCERVGPLEIHGSDSAYLHIRTDLSSQLVEIKVSEDRIPSRIEGNRASSRARGFQQDVRILGRRGD